MFLMNFDVLEVLEKLNSLIGKYIDVPNSFEEKSNKPSETLLRAQHLSSDI